MSKDFYKEIDKKTLKKLHDTELEILEEIDRICKKHKITYFLVGGTLLGAVRHKGFIPWDDDIDLGMFREDYNKFIDIAIKELNDKYFIHCNKTDNHYWLPFIKIKKNNTTFIEQFIEGKEILHSGIFVDIFPVDKTGSNYKINLIKGFLFRNITDCIAIKENKKTIKETRHQIINRFFLLFNKNKLFDFQNKIVKIYQHDDYIVVFSGAYHIKKELLEKKETFPLSEVTFENKKYKAYKNYDKNLSNLYGDYMKLPPVEKRINHAAAIINFTEGDNIISKDSVK